MGLNMVRGEVHSSTSLDLAGRQLGVTPWLEYVGTDDNIADLPSRGEWRLLLTLGGSGSFRAAVVPPVSSFVGPLLPLLGRRVAPV